MYLFTSIKYLFRKSNVGILIFFFLNAGLVIGLFGGGDPEKLKKIGILYLISVLLALSPIGEWFLGLMSGTRKMTRLDMRNRMQPIVSRVYSKALAQTPDMTKVIHLKVMYDPNPNAFALGRHTICVTEGLFELPDEMIEGIIAHEMGHLAYHHTDAQLIIGGGNLLITAVLLFFRIIAAIVIFIGSLISFSRDDDTHSAGCSLAFVGLIYSGMVWLWTKFCMLFLMWSSRANEYVADKYAMKIGYGYGLAAALDSIGTGTPQNSFMKALYSSHPETHDRIGRLQAMGVPYSRY